MSSFNINNFLENYQQYPCFWDKSLKDYKDRVKRDQAEEALVNITGLLNVKTLRSKIRSIRGAYNNELRKVKNSMITGSGSDEVYTPKLQWYSYANTFLGKNIDLEPESETNLNLNDELLVHNESETADTCGATTSQYTTQLSTSKRLISNENYISSKKPKKNDTLREALDTLKEVRKSVLDNEFTLFDQQIGIQLNKLPLRKAIEIQQKIQNMLTEARLNELSRLETSIDKSNTGLSHNMHYAEQSIGDYHGNASIQEVTLEHDYDNDIQETSEEEVEVEMTHFTNW